MTLCSLTILMAHSTILFFLFFLIFNSILFHNLEKAMCSLFFLKKILYVIRSHINKLSFFVNFIFISCFLQGLIRFFPSVIFTSPTLGIGMCLHHIRQLYFCLALDRVTSYATLVYALLRAPLGARFFSI